MVLLTSAWPAAFTSSKQAPLRPSLHFCFVYIVCPSGTVLYTKENVPDLFHTYFLFIAIFLCSESQCCLMNGQPSIPLLFSNLVKNLIFAHT